MANPRTPKTNAFVKEARRRGVEVLTQADWGSQRRGLYLERLTTRPHLLLPARPVDTLWNHITVTFDDGVLVGDFKADLLELERIGYDRFRSGISYNILVDANAPHPRLAVGQYLEAKGAHTVNDKGTPGFSYDQNAVALAIAWIGVPGDRLNEHAVEALVQARRALMTVGALTRHYDDVPHSLVAAKDCPTDELRNRLPELKRRALRDDPTPPPRQEDDMPNPEDLWSHKLREVDADTKAEALKAEVMLAQAHNRAGDAREFARKANARAARLEKAFRAFVKSFGPEVERAVLAALEQTEEEK